MIFWRKHKEPVPEGLQMLDRYVDLDVGDSLELRDQGSFLLTIKRQTSSEFKISVRYVTKPD